MTPLRALGLYWSSAVLRLLSAAESMSFSELFRGTRAGPSTLTATMRSLEEAGLVSHDPFESRYAITPKGARGLWVAQQLSEVDGSAPGPGSVGGERRAPKPGERFVEGAAARPKAWGL